MISYLQRGKKDVQFRGYRWQKNIWHKKTFYIIRFHESQISHAHRGALKTYHLVNAVSM